MGLDVGGTSTRVLIAGAGGEVIAYARGEGANPTTHGAPVAAARIGRAISAVLARAADRAGARPASVVAATIGLAGVARFRDDPAGRAALRAAWLETGLTCPYTLVPDALVAYAAGTARPDGTVVIAGTGAVAGAVVGFVLDRLAGGHGWLLSDEGSGFWLGREAVRATLSDVDYGRAPGPLGARVLTTALGSAEVRGRATAQALVQWATNRPPVALAELAPMVLAEYGTDPAAWAIVERAAAHLAETAAIAHEPAAHLAETATIVHEPAAHLAETATIAHEPAGKRPIVLAGGLLTGGTPLAAALTAALTAAWPGVEIARAGDAAGAAAWLAARDLPEIGDPADLHTRLVAPTAR